MFGCARSLLAAVVFSVCTLLPLWSQAADTKLVLQISDGGAEKQELLLNVANNLVSHYGSDLKLEVVAFGPGLRLLFADNANSVRVQSLTVSGVRFSACQNTVAGMTKILGHKPKLTEHAVPVEAGVARMVELSSQGYTLVRP